MHRSSPDHRMHNTHHCATPPLCIRLSLSCSTSSSQLTARLKSQFAELLRSASHSHTFTHSRSLPTHTAHASTPLLSPTPLREALHSSIAIRRAADAVRTSSLLTPQSLISHCLSQSDSHRTPSLASRWLASPSVALFSSQLVPLKAQPVHCTQSRLAALTAQRGLHS